MGDVPYRFTKEYRVGALELSRVSTLHLLKKHVCVMYIVWHLPLFMSAVVCGYVC